MREDIPRILPCNGRKIKLGGRWYSVISEKIAYLSFFYLLKNKTYFYCMGQIKFKK